MIDQGRPCADRRRDCRYLRALAALSVQLLMCKAIQRRAVIALGQPRHPDIFADKIAARLNGKHGGELFAREG